MEVDFIQRDERKVKFVVRGTTPAFANGVRRSIISDVPSLSIDQVDIYENTSVIFDEILSHRLGLVPLTTDLDSYSLPENCECEGEGCTNCEVVLTVDVEAEDEDKTVHSSDLESEDPAVEPADENIPVIELKPGQAVQAECVARLGKGKQHAKNQPGVSVGYKHLQRIVEDGEHDENIVRGVVESPDGELVNMEEYGNDLREAFGDDGEVDVGVEDVDDAFVFHVESDGSYEADELVLHAVDTLSNRADELGEKLAP